MPSGKYKSVSVALFCLSGCGFAALPANAATSACVQLQNTAQASLVTDGGTASLTSNTVVTRVAELLDLRLSATAPSAIVVPGEAGVIPFALANSGNGSEAFLIEGSIAGIDAALEGFAIDRDNDGRFDPAVDLLILAGAATPAVAAGASLALLALVRGNAAATGGTLTVTARATTGSGTPGSDYAGQGDGGCDAVVGGTTASGTASVSITVGAGSDTSQINVIKSQAVMAPNGAAMAVRGAIITYTIESRFGGSGVVRAVRLADPLPQGTAFVPGSLRLDGTALTDSADADGGAFDGATVRVTLGDVPAPAVRILQFQVVIQ